MLPYIDAPFKPIAEATGASIDELKLIFSFLLSYPLAAGLKRIPDSQPWQKNVFIISIGLFYLIGLFDLWAGVRTIVIDAVGAYAIAYYIDGTMMPWIAFVFLMGHMSANHITRQLANTPTVLDITGAQMVLIMRLHAFCWNVHDGRLKPELLTDYQKDRAIVKMPPFLNYTAYVMFFPSLHAGPAFDYNDYKRWIETTMFDVPSNAKAPPTRGTRKIPRSGIPATRKAVAGLGWIFLFLQMSKLYNVPLVLSQEYMTYSLPRRIWLLEMLGFTMRLKYYGVWSLTEGACILSGMGFNGVDPATSKVKWDRLNNVNPWGLETAQNSRAYLDNWNKNTNNWLRNYVYLRVVPKGKKPGFRASLLTFGTSAFWHGFYPGYYLAFVLAAFIQTVAKNFRRYVRPFFMTPDGKAGTQYKVYYDAMGYVVTQLGFSFTTLPFVVLGFSDSLKVWSRVYFYAVIGVVASLIFFNDALPMKKMLKKKLDERNHPHTLNTLTQETNYGPSLGMPDDPGREIDEAIDEIKAEVDARRRRGSRGAVMPTGQELKNAVEVKLGRPLKLSNLTAEGESTGVDVQSAKRLS